MREVAVIAFAQAPCVRREQRRNEVEILMPVVREAIECSGIPRAELDFICSGSADYLAGHGIESQRLFDNTGKKANLFATLGPKVDGRIVLSGQSSNHG